MQIIVTSDSHGRGELLHEIENWYPHAELYINCGDLEENPLNYPHWLFVRGNNDFVFGSDVMPEERIINVEGHKILICHSHRFSYYKREEQLAKYAMSQGCDIVLYGHTHIASVSIIHGVVIVNPGSLWMSRNGKSPSFAVLNIQGSNVEANIIYEEDWPKRKEEEPKKKRRWFK